jgi:FkbM family methyltransferase
MLPQYPIPVPGPRHIVSSNVRGIELRLVGYTRALELCARMNRETEVLDFIDAMRDGEVLYDLGACEGRFALYAALRGIRCYAFEPEALNFGALTENVAINAGKVLQLLTPLKYAVGETTRASTIRIAQPWAGGHQRVIADASRVDLNLDFTSEQEIDVVSLDTFIAAHGMPHPSHLKVDIDGSELPFIKGATATLQSPNLKAIMFELQSQDESYERVMSFLGSCGFVALRRHEIEPHLFNVWFVRQNGG